MPRVDLHGCPVGEVGRKLGVEGEGCHLVKWNLAAGTGVVEQEDASGQVGDGGLGGGGMGGGDFDY